MERLLCISTPSILLVLKFWLFGDLPRFKTKSKHACLTLTLNPTPRITFILTLWILGDLPWYNVSWQAGSPPLSKRQTRRLCNKINRASLSTSPLPDVCHYSTEWTSFQEIHPLLVFRRHITIGRSNLLDTSNMITSCIAKRGWGYTLASSINIKLYMPHTSYAPYCLAFSLA